MIPPNTDATGVFGWFFAALAVLAAVTAFAIARTTKAKLLAELRARADHDTMITAQQKSCASRVSATSQPASRTTSTIC